MLTVARVPGSDRLFLIAMDDGALMVFDKTRSNISEHKTATAKVRRRRSCRRPIQRRTPLSSSPARATMTATLPSTSTSLATCVQHHSQLWLDRRQMPLADLAFRDPEVVAAVGREGVLRVIDLKQERQVPAPAPPSHSACRPDICGGGVLWRADVRGLEPRRQVHCDGRAGRLGYSMRSRL